MPTPTRPLRARAGRLPSRRWQAGAAWGLAALLLALPARGTDYCVDEAIGSDAASGVLPDCWRSMGPTRTFPFAEGDTVHVRPGHYVYPTTAWYMLPRVSWIGAGPALTTVEYDKLSEVPFVRFRTGSQGSGPVADRRPGTFAPDTVLADMRILNTGRATVGVDVAVTSADSSPTLRGLVVEGFPIGIRMHPSSDERADASTHAVLTQNLIHSSSTAGFQSFADVFYPRLVVEGSTAVNTGLVSDGSPAVVKTLVQDLRDWPNAVAEPILTNDTLVGGAGSSLLLQAYYNDGGGGGDAPTTAQAGVLAPTIVNSVLSGSERYGLEETSPFTEPAQVRDSCLGGNAAGDYRDEGGGAVPAGSIGTGNIGAAPGFVDAPSGDVHQLAGSPTVDAADTASAPADDLDGHARPQGAAADMGADEHVACNATADASETMPGPPCTGRLTTLDASRSSIDPACAAGPRYLWFDQAGALVGEGQTLDVAPEEATTYRLRVTCADPALSACFDEDTVSVGAAPDPPLVDAGASRSECALAGQEVVIGVDAVVTLDPRATLRSLLWTSPEGAFDDPAAATTALRLTPAALPVDVPITVTVTDCNGEEATAGFTLSVLPSPQPMIEDPGLVCHDPDAAEVRLDLQGGSAGGTGAVAHSWSSTAGTISGDDVGSLILPNTGERQEVDVTLEVTDEEACSGATTLRVVVSPGTVADAGVDSDDCHAPGLVVIPLDGTTTRAPAGSTYRWTTDVGTVANGAAPSAELQLDLAELTLAATVTLEVTSASGDCSSVDQASLIARPLPVARPGGPYTEVRSVAPTTEIPLDGTATTGDGALTFEWTTDLGTFQDTGTAMSSLAAPTLVVVNEDVVQRGTACLTATSDNGCLSVPACADVVVLLEPVDPPNDIGSTLRVAKRPPDGVLLWWSDAAEDATHDLADRYEIWSAERACGPFLRRDVVGRVPGRNEAVDPVLGAPPPRRFYAIVSANDGGVSDDPAPDGTGCP